jgi:hypothetical protein
LGRRGVHIGFWWENQKERDHYEDLGIRERILLKMYLRMIGWAGMDRIDLVQVGDQWKAPVNTVMSWRGCNCITYELQETSVALSLSLSRCVVHSCNLHECNLSDILLYDLLVFSSRCKNSVKSLLK